MNFLPLDQIKVPEERQRRTFREESLAELAEDIVFSGLHNAICIREEAGTYWLVSGERRLRAVRHYISEQDLRYRYDGQVVPAGCIPAVTKGELSPLQAMENEWSENAIREDLDFRERAQAIARLHAARSTRAALRGEKQTLTMTAAEVFGEAAPAKISEVSKAVIVARELDNPIVHKAASLDEAFKGLRKEAERQQLEALGKKLGATQSVLRHTIKQGDMRELILEEPAGRYDVLITDPPYGVAAHKFGEQGSKERQYEDSADTEEWGQLMVLLAEQSFRICKEQAHAYIFCAFERFDLLSEIFRTCSWQVWPRPLIWDKGNGVLPRPEHGPRYTYECILFASKGDKRTRLVGADILRASNAEGHPGHPDSKPVSLYADLLKRSCIPGDFVIDPFAGSGPVFVAANRQQLTATGFEQRLGYYAISSKRAHGEEE
jgi:site-specific DNA-methyltransferase (adenine-specific)